MADLFLSYAREDREKARVLAAALEARGLSVWWDRKIVAGQTFDETIEHHLESARCVVVLWSEHSVESEWVRNEAAVASEREVLVPALVEPVKPPLEFRRRHTADLSQWDGDQSHPEFQTLCDGIAVKLTARPAAEVPPSAGTPPDTVSFSLPPPPFWRRIPRKAALAAAVVLAAALGGYAIWSSVSGDRIAVREDDSNVPRDRDNPVELPIGTVQKISLGPDQEYFVRLTEPVENVRILLDMRRADNEQSNLQSRLEVLDERGVVVKDRVIVFNALDVAARETATWSARPPATIGFKLLNGGAPADFWLAVQREPATRFVPMFGSVEPDPMSVDDPVSGVLAATEDHYYVTSLRRGEYQLLVDFANAERQNTNLQGKVALLDGDGGNARDVLRINELNVSYRAAETFTMLKDGEAILNVQNNSAPIRYTLRLSAAGAAKPGADRGASAPGGLTGRWNAQIERKGQKPFPMTFDFESRGSRLFGTAHYPTGDAGILDGEIAGSEVRFRTVHTPQFESAPAEIRFDGTLDAGTLTLTLQDVNGTARVIARRAAGD